MPTHLIPAEFATLQNFCVGIRLDPVERLHEISEVRCAQAHVDCSVVVHLARPTHCPMIVKVCAMVHTRTGGKTIKGYVGREQLYAELCRFFSEGT